MGFLLAMSVVRSRARVRLGCQDAVGGAVNWAAATVKGMAGSKWFRILILMTC